MSKLVFVFFLMISSSIFAQLQNDEKSVNQNITKETKRAKYYPNDGSRLPTIPDPIAFWSFDNESVEGQELSLGEDISPNQINLTIDNGRRLQSIVPFSSVYGNSLLFKSNTIVKVPAASDPNRDPFNPVKNSLSVSLWFRFHKGTPRKCILISKGCATSVTKEGWSLAVVKKDSKWMLRWRINAQTDSNKHDAGLEMELDTTYNKKGWNHVVGVIDAKQDIIALYLNGQGYYDDQESNAQSKDPKWEVLYLPEKKQEQFSCRKRVDGNYVQSSFKGDPRFLFANNPLCKAHRGAKRLGLKLPYSMRGADIKSTEELRIGHLKGHDDWNFIGRMDDIEIYKGHAISVKEAATLASENFLRFDDKTQKKLSDVDNSSGIILQNSPVVLPNESNISGACRHFGWPVAAKSGNRIAVSYSRIETHGGPRKPLGYSRAMVVVGKPNKKGKYEWQTPFDLNSMRKSNPPATAFDAYPESYREDGELAYKDSMRAIGTDYDGSILVMAPQAGFFVLPRDKDEWDPIQKAYDIETTPVFGTDLLAAEYPKAVAACGGPNIIKIGGKLHMIQSRFTGKHDSAKPIFVMASCDSQNYAWKQLRWYCDFECIEPSAMVYKYSVNDQWKYRIILIARTLSKKTIDEQEVKFENQYIFVAKKDGPILYDDWKNEGDFPFWVKKTNIKKTKLESSDEKPPTGFFGDTNDISYNGKRGRFEVIAGNRGANSAVGSEAGFNRMRIMLLSIGKDELIKPENMLGENELKFQTDGVLITRTHRYGAGAPGFDGFHTAGSIFDDENGIDDKLQRIFYYSGYKKRGAGIFQLVRKRK